LEYPEKSNRDFILQGKRYGINIYHAITVRLDTPGILHHVVIRGIEKTKIFTSKKIGKSLLKGRQKKSAKIKDKSSDKMDIN
jgi:hypothetical protein